MKRLLSSLLLVAGLALQAQAQGPVQMRIRMLAFEPELEATEAYVHDPAADPTAVSVPAPIKSYLNRDSSNVLLKAGKMVFTTKPDRASMTREGETIAEVAVPGNIKTALLIFLPGDPKAKAKARAMVIDDSEKAFPKSSYHVTNLSPFPVKLVLEGKVYDFTPGKQVLISDIPAGVANQIDMKAYTFQDNQTKMIASSSWTKPILTRSVIAFYVDPATNSMRLKAFDDLEPHDPQPQQPAPGTAPAAR